MKTQIHNFSYLILIQIFVLFLVGCTTKERMVSDEKLAVSAEENETFEIKKETILPKNFKGVLGSNKKQLLIPKVFLELASITRSKAELREGPGTKYLLLNKILEKEALVIIFDRKDSWVKIFDYESKTVGWLHEKTIAQVLPDKYNMNFSIDELPTGILLTDVKKAYTYPQEQALEVNIKKGTQFIVLKKTKWRVLVWLSETDSVMWIAKKEVG